MEKLGRGIVKARIPILVISILLLIPAALGYINTRVNYDILYYLPKEIDTMQGQDILLDEFQKGAYAIVVVDGMHGRELTKLEDKIENVDHVAKLISYNSIVGGDIPLEMIPEKLRSQFYNSDKDSTMLAIFFDDTTSSDGTMNAIKEIRKVTDGQCFISGMSAVVTDTKTLSEKETPIYVLIAVILACIVLALFMDSFLVPVFFMLSIGIAIVYNLGSNYFMGEVSYITKALAAVLQLGVTLDYSIFLWHSYKEMKEEYGDDHKEAMAHAIASTITSVVGSSITTVAGFIALCFMSFTLGMDLGIVMAKGVVLGVICCVTVLPSLLLVFDKAIEKTKHKVIIPDLGRIADWIVRHYGVFLIVFLVVLGPAIYGYTHTDVYYDLAGTLPKSLSSINANDKLNDDFEMGATHMIIADSSLSAKDASAMLDEISKVDGVKMALGFDSLVGPGIPREFIPDDVKDVLINGDYQMMVVGSEYAVASDEVNAQCEEINNIIKKYDSSAMLIGEAPCTKDLIEITDEDFKTVSIVSIGAIFVIIALVFKSVSLPIILVAVIEFAIFINMGIPAYTHTTLPFIASIVIGTIQLGATVDYAILMTTKYKKLRYNGADKREAIATALRSSIQSIIVSALSFFAATFGVGMYSNIDMISSLCILMARGAIISMFVVIFILPSMFMIFDKLICATSMGFRNKKGTTVNVSENNVSVQ